MSFALLALLAAVPAQEPEAVVYKDDILNVAFSHPKAWRQVKRDKRETIFEIPLANSEDKATLQIIRSAFRGDPEVWQTIQLRSNELSKNTVVRQWEQTLLDAPLLLTQAELNDKGRRLTRLTGLHYTKTALKLLFNMDVPTAKFDEAQYIFNGSLESFRTIDGSNFVRENPDEAAPTGKPASVTPVRTVDDGRGRKTGSVRLKNEVETTVGSLKSIVRFRDGWTGTASDKGVEFTSKRLTGSVLAEPGTPLDTSPAAALRAHAGESLGTYTKVGRREDRDPATNEAGATVSWVLRRGESAEGARQSLDALVTSGDRYLLLRYVGTDSKRFDAERGALIELLDRLTVEAAP